MDRAEDIDIATPSLDLLAQAEAVVEPSRGHGSCADRACIVGCHGSTSGGACSRSKIVGETAEFVAILLRQLRHLAR
jgi:hypothetical protein